MFIVHVMCIFYYLIIDIVVYSRRIKIIFVFKKKIK